VCFLKRANSCLLETSNFLLKMILVSTPNQQQKSIIQSELVLRDENGHRNHPGVPLLPQLIVRRHVNLYLVFPRSLNTLLRVQVSSGAPVSDLLQPEQLLITLLQLKLVPLPPPPRLHPDPEDLLRSFQIRGDVHIVIVY